MTQEEHLAWAKERALELVEKGDVTQAVIQMALDLREHRELQNHPGIQKWFMLAVLRPGSTGQDVRRWIEGFR